MVLVVNFRSELREGEYNRRGQKPLLEKAN